jgi:hypothetical protein
MHVSRVQSLCEKQHIGFLDTIKNDSKEGRAYKNTIVWGCMMSAKKGMG